ncbi:unnamed protein product [Choristocarpus tenellus]
MLDGLRSRVLMPLHRLYLKQTSILSNKDSLLCTKGGRSDAFPKWCDIYLASSSCYQVPLICRAFVCDSFS